MFHLVEHYIKGRNDFFVCKRNESFWVLLENIIKIGHVLDFLKPEKSFFKQSLYMNNVSKYIAHNPLIDTA